MKIGIDARFFGPSSKGLGRYTQKLITHLEHIDNENEYVVFLRKQNFDEFKPLNDRFTKVCADYQWYSIAEQTLFPFMLYKYKCDIVHFPHFNVPIFYFKKFIVTIHDLILLRYPTKKSSTHSFLLYWFKFWMYKIVITSAIIKAKKIIAVSEFTKRDLCLQYKLACNKTIVTYEAAEITQTNIDNGEIILKKYGIIEPYMLYVGNAYPHKNLDCLVDAFSIYVENGGIVKNLILVGCNDYFYKNLRQYIKNKDVSNIIILETITDELLKILYIKANFFVFPSLYEGFGLPPLEAQLFSIPVLSSNHECMIEILSTQGALFCDTTDVNDFAKSMQKISMNKKLRLNLIEIGNKNAKKYSWSKMAQQTYNIYRNNI
jgi:glycosyltransferase involved in cell wall biosynthesis